MVKRCQNRLTMHPVKLNWRRDEREWNEQRWNKRRVHKERNANAYRATQTPTERCSPCSAAKFWTDQNFKTEQMCIRRLKKEHAIQRQNDYRTGKTSNKQTPNSPFFYSFHVRYSLFFAVWPRLIFGIEKYSKSACWFVCVFVLKYDFCSAVRHLLSHRLPFGHRAFHSARGRRVFDNRLIPARYLLCRCLVITSFYGSCSALVLPLFGSRLQFLTLKLINFCPVLSVRRPFGLCYLHTLHAFGLCSVYVRYWSL